MIRSRGSVPETRTSTRPSRPREALALLISSASALSAAYLAFWAASALTLMMTWGYRSIMPPIRESLTPFSRAMANSLTADICPSPVVA